MGDSREKTLAGFLKRMGFERKKIIKGSISDRIRAQKLVYFGKALGLPLNYDFNLYVYGPYSSVLSNDYFGMGEEVWTNGSIEIPEDISMTLNQLKKQDELFLEIAATLHSIKTANPDASEDDIIGAVSNIKSERLRERKVTSDYVRKILEVIKKMKLI